MFQCSNEHQMSVQWDFHDVCYQSKATNRSSVSGRQWRCDKSLEKAIGMKTVTDLNKGQVLIKDSCQRASCGGFMLEIATMSAEVYLKGTTKLIPVWKKHTQVHKLHHSESKLSFAFCVLEMIYDVTFVVMTNKCIYTRRAIFSELSKVKKQLGILGPK